MLAYPSLSAWLEVANMQNAVNRMKKRLIAFAMGDLRSCFLQAAPAFKHSGATDTVKIVFCKKEVVVKGRFMPIEFDATSDCAAWEAVARATR